MPRGADIKKAKIRDFVGQEISIKDYLDEGNDAVVCIGNFKTQDDLFDLAIKFYMPIHVPSLFTQKSWLPIFNEDLKDRYNNELKRLKTLSHPNLQQYQSCGELDYTHFYFHKICPDLEKGTKIPFIVSRYVRGKRLDRIVKPELVNNDSNFVLYLHGIANGLAYLHRNRILHADVRPENVIIESDKDIPVLIDFGLSKGFTLTETQYTKLFVDVNPIPDKIRNVLQRLQKDRHEFDRELLGAVLFPVLDLYQFGLMLQRLLATEFLNKLSMFETKYLELLVKELKKWEIVKADQFRPETALVGSIKSADDLVKILDRLLDGPDYFNHEFARTEVVPSRPIVRIKGSVEVRQSLKPIMEHPALGRLHNLRQLSLLNYVYPSAGQSRFDHSLSVLGQTQKVWQVLAKDPTFLFLMSIDDIDRLELVALLHDVNHFPFLHYFQEAGIPDFSKVDILNTFMSMEVSTRPDKRSDTLEEAIIKHGVDIEYIRSLIIGATPKKWRPQDQIIKSLINGGVDVDKLAYLPDDSLFTGAPFGLGVDFFGLLDNIGVAEVKLNEETEENVWHIVFSQNALPAVESVCFARYWHFQRTYWHHTNRSIASMIIWTIREIYSRPEHSLKTYLFETRNIGQAGALEYLASTYHNTFHKESPIAGLSTNRDLIYRSVFEMSFKDKPELLSVYQNEEFGFEKRQNVQLQVLEIVSVCLKKFGYGETLRECDVLLDIPLRKMDLGGPIFIKEYDGSVEKVVNRSDLLKELERSFESMSKILRVYVAPWIRDIISKLEVSEQDKLKRSVYQTICGGISQTEVK